MDLVFLAALREEVLHEEDVVADDAAAVVAHHDRGRERVGLLHYLAGAAIPGEIKWLYAYYEPYHKKCQSHFRYFFMRQQFFGSGGS